MRRGIHLACLLVALCWHGDASSLSRFDAKSLAWVAPHLPGRPGGAKLWAGMRASLGGEGRSLARLGPPAGRLLRHRRGDGEGVGGFTGLCMCAESGKGGKGGTDDLSPGNKARGARRDKGVMSMEEEERNLMKRMDAELERRATGGISPAQSIDDVVDLGFAASTAQQDAAGDQEGQGKSRKGKKGGRKRAGRKGIELDPLEEYVNQLLLSTPGGLPSAIDEVVPGVEAASPTYIDEVLGTVSSASTSTPEAAEEEAASAAAVPIVQGSEGSGQVLAGAGEGPEGKGKNKAGGGVGESSPSSPGRGSEPWVVGGGSSIEDGGAGVIVPSGLAARLKDEFSILDSNGDGRITSSEMRKRLLRDSRWSKDDVKELVERLDSNRDGVVSEKEYVDAMSAAVVQRLVREFCALDADDDGKVTYSELRAWLFGSGGWDEREVEELMELLDMDHDGAVTQEEYIRAMSSRGEGSVLEVVVEEEEEDQDGEGGEEGGDVGMQLARMFEADGGEEGDVQRELERVAREERKRQRAFEKRVEWEESQARERAAGGPEGRKSGTVSRGGDGATKQGGGEGDDAGSRIVADCVDLEKELAVEEEMERQEGEYARQLFSLREEETRIISEPKRRELKALLLKWGATEADANLASELQNSFGDEWKGMLGALREETGMGGSNMCNMLSRDRRLLMLRPERLVRLVTFLRQTLGMNNKTLRYILGRRPSLISLPVYGGDGEGVSKLVANVMSLGVTQKQLRIMATKTPGVLSTPPNNVIKVADELTSAGLHTGEVASVVRKAPWILLYDSKLEVQPVLECLRSVGVRDMGNVVKAYPDVLCLCPDEQILRVCGVLLECGIEAYSIAKMIEMCPAFLGVPVDVHLLPMLDYFEVELDISLDDIGDMLRHYPGTLLLSLDRDVRPKEEFLRDVGLRNVGRVITLAPQILTFDVGTQLLPKMRFLDKVGLTSYDMANFPQLFSYPLDSVIRPRLLFLVYLRIPTTSKPLKYVITPNDFDFCNVTLDGVPSDKYAAFVAALPPMELPQVPKGNRHALAGRVAFTRMENGNAAMRVKGDARLVGYKALKAGLVKEVAVGAGAVQGREFFDQESKRWVYEGPKQESPSYTTRGMELDGGDGLDFGGGGGRKDGAVDSGGGEAVL